MSTQTKHDAAPIGAAFEEIRDLNAQFLSVARKAGLLYLESYETAVDRTVDLEVKLAGLTRQEWLTNVIEAQADVAREITASYTRTARSLLK